MVLLRASCLLLLLFALGCDNDRPRELVVVARGVTFVVPADSAKPNPRITLTPGERVHVTLRSEAPGLIHDFQIPAWNVKTDRVRGGESTSVSFVAPEKEERAQYLSSPHAATMHGIIEVKAP
jgi:heme/copper-type cytochrome/quinol oxidase subunit 2